MRFDELVVGANFLEQGVLSLIGDEFDQIRVIDSDGFAKIGLGFVDALIEVENVRGADNKAQIPVSRECFDLSRAEPPKSPVPADLEVEDLGDFGVMLVWKAAFFPEGYLLAEKVMKRLVGQRSSVFRLELLRQRKDARLRGFLKEEEEKVTEV